MLQVAAPPGSGMSSNTSPVYGLVFQRKSTTYFSGVITGSGMTDT
jgi:hypothetical protein